MIHYLLLLRPKEWIKNLFLFIPLFFAGKFFDPPLFFNVLIGFFVFCLIASAVYILNDIKDIELDKSHPVKKYRVLSSGKLSVNKAVVILILLVIFSLIGSYYLNNYFFYLIIVYLIVNIFYSFGFKNISIVDLFLVSIGFIIRIVSGGVLANVPITEWLVIMVMLLSLFLVLGKRRNDLYLQEDEHIPLRKSSATYSVAFINSSLTMLSAVLLVSYIMYTVSEEVQLRMGSQYLYITSLFVVAGILRYLQILLVENKGGSPTSIIYKDKFIIFTVFGWLITFWLLLY